MLIATCVATASLPVPVDGKQASNPSRQASQSAQATALRIVVLAGEDAVNVVQQRTAVAPVVEVRDRNDQPVAGAVVTFAVRGGRATFSGARTLSLTTNAAGRAAVTGLTPTGTGTFQITASTAFQGQTAAATITQTNFATAAQAAASGASGSGASGTAGSGGGGGGLGAGTITAIAGGVVGGLYTYKKLTDIGPPPSILSVTPRVAVGLQNSTLFLIDFQLVENLGPSGIKYAIDYGDGTIASYDMRNANGEELSADLAQGHLYTSAGTFTVRVTVTDDRNRSDQGQTTVTVKSMSGRWALGTTGSFYDLTQAGSVIGGTFTAASGPGSGVVTGSIAREGPPTNLTLNVVPAGGGSPSTFAAIVFISPSGATDTADLLTGSFTSGNSRTVVQLRRQ